MPDESLRRTEEGLVPETGGRFVVHAAAARWWDHGPFGWFTRFSGDEHGTDVEQETDSPEEAYASRPEAVPVRYREGWLPGT